MRINPVNYNIVQIAPKQKVNQTFKNNVNAKTGNFVQQNAPSFTGYGSGKYKITDLDLVQISDLIRKTDSQRLDESGKTVQGVYPYAGKYMVKSPDALIHDTALKEYSILNKIRDLKGGETICPKPFEIAQSANRPFLVEEFIPGKHAGELPITLKDVKGLAEKFIILDQGGIINQDLSPRNVIYMPNGETRMIDFDTFSYLVGDGRIFHSQSTPSEFFATLVPKENLKNLNPGNFADFKFKNLDRTIEEKFAASFTCDDRLAAGLRDLTHVRNIPDNPFIGVPSNLSNYEARTLYTRIMAHDIEDPVGFLQDYIQMKANTYHKPMREFLRTLEVKESYCDGIGDRIPFEEAKMRLKKAIKFEDVYISLFSQEKPDVYFAKLQAAKIQLNALVAEAQISKHASNGAQVPKAYENLMRVLTEGLDRYDDPKRRFYLKSELEHYKKLFSKTNLSTTNPPIRIDANMDILDMWFSDPAFDGKSFATLSRKAKSSAIKLFTENGIRETQTVSDEVIKQAEELVRQELEPSRIKVPETRFEEGVKELIQNAIEEAKTFKEKGPKRPVKIKYDENGRIINLKQVMGIFVPKLHLDQTAEEAMEEYSKTYSIGKYVKQGNKWLLGICAIAAVGGGILYKYLDAKNKKRELQKPVLVETPKLYTDVFEQKGIKVDENSPFKNFVK